MGILNTIFDVIFPVNCVACGKRGELLCQDCLVSSPSAERESEKWIFPLYDYRHKAIKRSIWLLKYKNKKGLAKIFARALYSRILEEISERIILENFKNPVLVPIPLADKRKRERGFNQAELLSREIMLLDSEKNLELVSKALIKPRETKHQAMINDRRKRMRNIEGSFEIKTKSLIEGRNIILIDDVTTTGATLKEARKILKEAGAKKIIAFTIAH
jgi:competence protein ComFC